MSEPVARRVSTEPASWPLLITILLSASASLVCHSIGVLRFMVRTPAHVPSLLLSKATLDTEGVVACASDTAPAAAKQRTAAASDPAHRLPCISPPPPRLYNHNHRALKYPQDRAGRLRPELRGGAPSGKPR